MRTAQLQKDERIMRHSDNMTVAALWWKVVFLLPIWGIIPAALLGFFMTQCGTVLTEIGFIIVLVCGLWYFIEDILKRKIKIADGVLYFGYRNWMLSKLKTVAVGYETDKIIPKDMILTFQDGYILPFELSRIDAKDVQYIVKYIDRHYPHCTVDSTLRTLARCQELGPRLRSIDAQIEVPYNSHRVLHETYKGFMSSLSSWSRLGPLVVWVCCAPIWISATMFCYALHKTYSNWNSQSVAQQLAAGSFFVLSFVGAILSKGAETAAIAVANPFVAIIAGLITCFLFVKLVKNLTEPNLLILDDKGISFLQGYKWIRYKLSWLAWSDLKSAEIERPPNSQPDDWNILLKDRNGKVLKRLKYAALESKGRADLYERLKHFAPACSVTAELAEGLMAQQNNSYTELWLQSLSSSPNRDNLDPLQPGDTLNEGRYEIVMKLGVGGQGAAYLSRENSIVDKQLCQEVVLKETIFPVFVEDSVRRQALERFEHEARTLNLLSHDHIVKLLDYFVEDHRGYLVLEHIEGQNLRDHASVKPMAERDVIELALQMCDMLEYLHEKNVIHRDFTPDNLMLERSGTLKLIDFNVAQTQATGMTGTVVGKHSYLPPEQFRGKPVPASDIYAMGCSLFYLLSGHDPAPITQSKISEERPEVGTAIDTIIRKCTNLKAENRYQDIATLRADLKNALENVGERGATINIASPAAEPVKLAAGHGTAGSTMTEETIVRKEHD
jgi:tRNA A-37 threonylcarbamoyl transferase component Bud32